MARRLSAMRQFYKYLLLDRMIEQDPTLNIDTPRQWKVLPKSLSRSETESLLQARPPRIEDAWRLAMAARDRAMLELLYGGALRVSEVVGIALNDLKIEQGYVLVRGKGDKERIVPLGRAAVEAVQAYVSGPRSVLAGQRSSRAGVHRARGAAPDPAAGVANGACGIAGGRARRHRRTCCGTVAPPTWWKTAPTCAPCRPFSVTPTFRRRRCTRTWRWTG